VARFAVWGALGGLMLALVPAALVVVGQATLARDFHSGKSRP
jgi:hypothetical protein